jgi:2-polyprenyl-3-methyl-5-hydroxy-6-metoxy-1,4-benzoquinol methylase
MTFNSPSHVGAFDFKDYTDVVQSLSRVLDLAENEVQERLFNEAVCCGWNVSKAAEAFGVTPHVYNGRMEEFYKSTNAFVFETLVTHLNHFCQEVDRRVVEAVEAYFGENKRVKILALGDGIGSDSLRFAVIGHEVTYFEFQGYSAAFANYRFQRQGLDGKIRVLHQTADIPIQQFDVVLCREVLEHVNNPPELVENIWQYLKREGIAIVTESFGRVEPAFPTHLAENKKYDGKTEFLFADVGFYLLKSFSDKRPMIFRKVEKSDKTRYASLKPSYDVRTRKYVVQDKIRQMGKRALQLVKF